MSNALRHPDRAAPSDVEEASLVVCVGQGDGICARYVGSILPVKISWDVTVVVVVFNPPCVGVDGEEGSED